MAILPMAMAMAWRGDGDGDAPDAEGDGDLSDVVNVWNGSSECSSQFRNIRGHFKVHIYCSQLQL
jgi:hypothetical protein